MPKRFKGYDIKRAKGVVFRNVQSHDLNCEGQSLGDSRGGYISFVKTTDPNLIWLDENGNPIERKNSVKLDWNSVEKAEAIPVGHSRTNMAYGRRHIRTSRYCKTMYDRENNLADIRLYWTCPVYVGLDGYAYHGTSRFVPLNGDVNDRPRGLSYVEATEAYTKLRESAKRELRKLQRPGEKDMYGKGGWEIDVNFQEWRLKIANEGLAWANKKLLPST